MLFLRKGTYASLVIGPFLQASNGTIPQIALSLTAADIRLSKNGKMFVAMNCDHTNTAYENGWYTVCVNSTDTTALGRLVLNVTKVLCLPVFHEYEVISRGYWDGMHNAGGASSLASIADAVWDEAQSGHVAVGSFGTEVHRLRTTGIGSMGSIVDYVWDEMQSEHIVAGSFGTTHRIQTIGSGSLASIADVVWDEPIGGHVATGTFGTAVHRLRTTGTGSMASIVDYVWDELRSAHVIVGSFGTMNRIQTSTLASIADAVLDEPVEGTYTLRQIQQLLSSATFGSVSGGGTTTITFRDISDTKNRIVATVDANGNRSEVVKTVD